MPEFSPGSYTDEGKMHEPSFGSYIKASDLDAAVYQVAKQEAKKKGIPESELVDVLHATRPERVSDLPDVFNSAMFKELEAKYPQPIKEPSTYVEDPNPFNYRSSNK